ncbi:hypothetical protein HN873_007882, partial [Arachis hypogaea]
SRKSDKLGSARGVMAGESAHFHNREEDDVNQNGKIERKADIVDSEGIPKGSTTCNIGMRSKEWSKAINNKQICEEGGMIFLICAENKVLKKLMEFKNIK